MGGSIKVQKWGFMHKGFCVVCQDYSPGAVEIELITDFELDDSAKIEVCPFHAGEIMKKLESIL